MCLQKTCKDDSCRIYIEEEHIENEDPMEYHCKGCDGIFPADKFKKYKRKSGVIMLHGKCKICQIGICQEEGCDTLQKYKKGGKKGYCKKHGGYPICKQTGCNTPESYMEGGKKGLLY